MISIAVLRTQISPSQSASPRPAIPIRIPVPPPLHPPSPSPLPFCLCLVARIAPQIKAKATTKPVCPTACGTVASAPANAVVCVENGVTAADDGYAAALG